MNEELKKAANAIKQLRDSMRQCVRDQMEDKRHDAEAMVQRALSNVWPDCKVYIWSKEGAADHWVIHKSANAQQLWHVENTVQSPIKNQLQTLDLYMLAEELLSQHSLDLLEKEGEQYFETMNKNELKLARKRF